MTYYNDPYGVALKAREMLEREISKERFNNKTNWELKKH